MKILIAEDSQTQAVDLRRRLEAMGHEVIVAQDGLRAWNLLLSRPKPLVISDWMMHEMHGLELCRKIRTELQSPYIYVILLTAKSHRHERLQGLNAGADDFLAKPIDSRELETALKSAQRIILAQEELRTRALQLQRRNEQLALLAVTDRATGLRHQQGFDEALQTAALRAHEDRLPLSLIRLELDQIDGILSTLEPVRFQELLAGVAGLLRKVSRDCDTAARIGSHGSALILPGLTGQSALRVADDFSGLIKAQPPARIPVKASIGVASLDPDMQPATPAHLLAHCDVAVKMAQEKAGDRVVAFELAGAQSRTSWTDHSPVNPGR
jgi:diguanylate cyclase (GGDEF)-like protein